MPSIWSTIPRDAYAANAYLGTHAQRGLPGQMRVVRTGRNIDLLYRDVNVCQWRPDGTLVVYAPLIGRHYRTNRNLPTRGLYSRIAQVLPFDWELEVRPPTRRGPRYPNLLYRNTYRLPLETQVYFTPAGGIRTSDYVAYETTRADLDSAVEMERAGRRGRPRPPEPQPTLPAWVGRDTGAPSPRRRRTYTVNSDQSSTTVNAAGSLLEAMRNLTSQSLDLEA